MILFALRHKPTGRLMPARKRGHTWWNPEIQPTKPTVPHFFISTGAAKNALSWWEMGQWGNDPEEGYPVLSNKMPERRGTLEVVPMKVKETSL